MQEDFLGECFPSWRNTQEETVPALTVAFVGPGGGQRVFMVPLKPVQFQAPTLRMVCRVELLGPIYPAGPSPLPSPRVLSRGAINTCLVLGLRKGGWSQGPWGRLLLAGAAGGFHSLIYQSKDLVLATDGLEETSSLSHACSLGVYIYPFKN